MREGAGIKDTDTSTWDLLGNAGREAKQSAFERALAGLMSACSTVHKGGSCTASPTKVCLILERLLVNVPPDRNTATTPNTRRPKIRPLYPSNSPLGFVLCAHSTCLTKADLPRYCARRCASI